MVHASVHGQSHKHSQPGIPIVRTYSSFKNMSLGLLGLTLLASVSCSKSGRTVSYYYPDDLKGMSLPVWEVTNSIPLPPDKAVMAAASYASTRHPTITSWDVENIGLGKEFGTTNTWIYDISLTDPKSGSREYSIRVLMDGTIWKPTTERRY